ncbi:hypothetical protein B0H14DRAFT_2637218 [Mycena olivaceomarginata]|nr:hypothetical protein B0H14DRAFT_2637218 [Mycena olivaceomarginata]
MTLSLKNSYKTIFLCSSLIDIIFPGYQCTAEISGVRSSTINSLRGVIASILSSAGHTVNSQILVVAAADRSQDKVLLGLLRFPEDKTSKLFAILLPKGQKKMQFIILSKIVLDIHRVLAYGPSGLAAHSKPDAKSNGIKYGIFEATDHSVALAGTLDVSTAEKGQSRFLVSADKTLSRFLPRHFKTTLMCQGPSKVTGSLDLSRY